LEALQNQYVQADPQLALAMKRKTFVGTRGISAAQAVGGQGSNQSSSRAIS